MGKVLERHDSILRTAIEGHGGIVFKTVGDAFCAAFESPTDAIAACHAFQQALANEGWPDGFTIKVRAGLHMGPAQVRDQDFFGRTVNRCARIQGIAHGGQTVASAATVAAAELPAGASAVDLGSHRLKDLEQAEEVRQIDFPGLPGDFPPLRSLGSDDLPNNLPVNLPSFVGREEEVSDLAAKMGETPLITLTGTGGSGKTRLALQAAAERLTNHANGVWFVDLAPVPQDGSVPMAVATALGIPIDRSEELIPALAKRDMLLILDNCEHLVEACARFVAEALAQCPDLSIVATSREPLGLAQEQHWPVQALDLPHEDDSLADLESREAIQLFLERAAAAKPGFALDEENAEAISAICRRLDGIPLAIELAAARTRSMSPSKIAERLDDSFRLLVSSDRMASPRQKTLTGLIAWSYELLSPPEQVLLQRLSHFAGGWTLERAEAICSDEPGDDMIEGELIIDLLTGLADKSLVAANHLGAADRYGMLESIRAFARAELESGEGLEPIARRHSQFYVDQAERWSETLAGDQQGQCIAELLPDQENLLLAARNAHLLEDDGLAACELAWALKLFWIAISQLARGYEFTKAVLHAAEDAPENDVKARVNSLVAQYLYLMGRYEEALPFNERCLAIFEREDSDYGRFRGMIWRGHLLHGLGRHEEALPSFTRALELAEATGSVQLQAAANNGLCEYHRERGNFEDALRFSRLAVEQQRQLGQTIDLGTELLNLSMLYLMQGQVEEGHDMAREAADLKDTLKADLNHPALLGVAARLALESGDHVQAARIHAAMERYSTDRDIQLNPSDQAFVDETFSRAQAQLGEERATQEYRAGWEDRALGGDATIDRWLKAATLL